jgi:uncharacterized protein YicC (UPF0701 family)
MTGFGEGRASVPAGTARVAVSAVNNRGLAVQVRGDLRDPALEERVRERVKAAALRGTVAVQLAWEPAGAGGLDTRRVAAVWRELAALAAELGAPSPPLADALALARGAGGAPPDEAAVMAALDEALGRFDEARRREGEATAAVLRDAAARMRSLHAAMSASSGGRVARVRERLQAALADAIGRALPAEAVAREVALEVTRIDVAEELSRLAAHLDALDRLLARGDGIGRELDFLAQELGREANTTAAKANDAALAEQCIAFKVAVDQVKEQAANCL